MAQHQHESQQETPTPIHRIISPVLLPMPPRGSALSWPPAQAVLSQSQLQPSAIAPAQPWPLPLATQLNQILKITLLKLQYILFLASKYPSVSTWLSSATLQPPAHNLSVLDFLFDSYKKEEKISGASGMALEEQPLMWWLSAGGDT